MKPQEITGLHIGEGMPKTIVSLTGATAAECLTETERACEAGVDVLEWRADFASCANDPAALVDMGHVIAAKCYVPLLLTLRSAREGGERDFDPEAYLSLNRSLIKAGIADLIDIEARIGDDTARTLAHYAHAHNVATVISHHNFQLTPSIEWMTDMLRHMIRLGADIPKLAVMAHDESDALRLLSATNQMRYETDCPLITIAMGRKGAITRLVGEAFGSSMTFCALGNASAPGQVSLEQTRRILHDVHAALDE